MDKQKILDWLDGRIQSVEESRLIDLDGEVVCYDLDSIRGRILKEIFIDNAARIAEILGSNIKFAPFESEEYPIRISFTYKGYEFYSVE